MPQITKDVDIEVWFYVIQVLLTVCTLLASRNNFSSFTRGDQHPTTSTPRVIRNSTCFERHTDTNSFPSLSRASAYVLDFRFLFKCDASDEFQSRERCT